MQKILIATTNEGKFHEAVNLFSALHFTFVNLKQVGLEKYDVAEPYNTTWENALTKAKFYGKKSGLLTLSEDAALYIDAMNGAPGIKAKRFGATATERNQKILTALKNVPTNKRTVRFELSACLYNPQNDSFSIFNGGVKGLISQKEVGQARHKGMGYDPIFYYPPLKKNFSELSVAEKNTVSHRGQALLKVKYFLEKQFHFRQLVVPAAIIVKDRKMFFQKRRDSRKEFDKWEFPGGGVENGEDLIGCLKREVKDETGFNVEPLELLSPIMNRVEKKYSYQVFLPVYICKIKSGKIKVAHNEVSDHGWFTIKEALKLKFLPLNKEISKANLDILKKYSD
ncbi:MAG: NUDIX domain-containing protein [Candidatus Magasanikbacteria bacterium]|nr:NUDIX domain-containing protein [Candidatus Magasanikbacteria bacterium]